MQPLQLEKAALLVAYLCASTPTSAVQKPQSNPQPELKGDRLFGSDLPGSSSYTIPPEPVEGK